jgi:hypothetical protein
MGALALQKLLMVWVNERVGQQVVPSRPFLTISS